MTRIVTITSGKGGVGKTNVSVNVALHLAEQGYKTCLFDADLGLANINILLGLRPELNLKDVVLGDKSIDDILIKDFNGIDILPGSSGVEEIANLSTDQIKPLIEDFSKLSLYDFIIFDTSAGIHTNVMSFCMASEEVVVVITPEPTSLTDAYALVKTLALNNYRGDVKVIINQCKTVAVAKLVYSKFKNAVEKHLGLQILSLGMIYLDEKVTDAVSQQKPLLRLYPESNASRCMGKIAEKIIANKPDNLEETDIKSFWNKCLGFFTSSKKKEQTTKDIPLLSADTHPPEKVSMPSTHEEKPVEKKAMPLTKPSGISSVPAGQGPDNLMVPMMEKLIESIMSVSKELELTRTSKNGKGKKLEPIKIDVEGMLKSKGIESRKES
ncbi:MAG: MinD/ParA family protein [Desulfobacterales bacterium]|nr:MinD/ParA family protein [Desulfobacterales bacterium]